MYSAALLPRNKRREPRRSLHGSAMARCCNLPVMFQVELRDVSERGIGFRCVWAVTEGEVIMLGLPALGATSTTAVVRHARRDGEYWVVGAELLDQKFDLALTKMSAR